MNKQKFDLNNSLVVLRKLKATDKENVIDLLSDPDVMAFIGPRRPMSHDEIDGWLRENIKKYEFDWNRWAVALADNDEFIGMAGIQPENGGYDFGYYFRKSIWGKGIAKVSVKFAVMNIDVKALKISAFIASDNIRSIRLAESIGLIRGEAKSKNEENGFCYSLQQT